MPWGECKYKQTLQTSFRIYCNFDGFTLHFLVREILALTIASLIKRRFISFSVQKSSGSCSVVGKCSHSQKRNMAPHNIRVSFTDGSENPAIASAHCTCPVGLTMSCGHIIGLLYQLASYKSLGLKALPEDIAKTSQPQTWHEPRGEKIHGKAVQDLEVSGYSRAGKRRDADGVPQMLRSTLYNPIRGKPVDWKANLHNLKEAMPNMLALPALQNFGVAAVSTRFGQTALGSFLSYQQKTPDDYVLYICDGVTYPELPVRNVMQTNFCAVLRAEEAVTQKGLHLTMPEIKRFEEQTRLQRHSRLWYRIRKNRITASKVGDINSRRKDFETLARRLKSTRQVVTAAMREGLASEPIAARCYAEKALNKSVNLYPSGIIVNFWCPWLAASPDRKVYNPQRFPAFGLLEIKCPQVSSVLEAKYLVKTATGQLELRRTHPYYFQILMQLAVTGLEWCDFFVWCTNDFHVETVYFNEDVWQQVKDKVDSFFFQYFI